MTEEETKTKEILVDTYETKIEIPITVHFELNKQEPSTYHSPEIPAYVDIGAIELYGHDIGWELCKAILGEHLLELEEEILERAKA